MTGNLQADGVQSRQTLFVRYCLKDGIPRLCGEKFHNFIFHKLFIGSPPPMRGKDVEFEVNADGSRITPAYAGKSIGKPSAATTTQDHPRLCGEKLAGGGQGNFWTGSPPPMRGKDTELVGMLAGGGITPAYAGKSYPSPAYYNTHKDHPRLCGEKMISPP